MSQPDFGVSQPVPAGQRLHRRSERPKRARNRRCAAGDAPEKLGQTPAELGQLQKCVEQVSQPDFGVSQPVPASQKLHRRSERPKSAQTGRFDARDGHGRLGQTLYGLGQLKGSVGQVSHQFASMSQPVPIHPSLSRRLKWPKTAKNDSFGAGTACQGLGQTGTWLGQHQKVRNCVSQLLAAVSQLPACCPSAQNADNDDFWSKNQQTNQNVATRGASGCWDSLGQHGRRCPSVSQHCPSLSQRVPSLSQGRPKAKSGKKWQKSPRWTSDLRMRLRECHQTDF